MNARVLQILTRLTTKGLVFATAWMGAKLTDGQINSVVDPVVTGVMALGTFLLDLYLHRLQQLAEK